MKFSKYLTFVQLMIFPEQSVTTINLISCSEFHTYQVCHLFFFSDLRHHLTKDIYCTINKSSFKPRYRHVEGLGTHMKH